MGAMRAMDIADNFDLEQGIGVHLQTNHTPPYLLKWCQSVLTLSTQ